MVKMDKEKSLSTPQKKDFKVHIKIGATPNNNTEKTECVELSYISSLPQEHISVYNLFKQKDYKELKERLQDMDVFFQGHTFNSYFEFKESLIKNNKISMVTVLELPIVEDNLFKDILNGFASTKTATVYRTNTEGIEYYHTDKNRHIVDLVGELIGEKQLETCKILARLFNVTIIEPENIVEIRESVKNMITILRSEYLCDYMPNFYKLFKNYINVTCCLLENISKQDVLYDLKSEEYKIYSYLALKSYSLSYEKEYTGFKMSIGMMNRHLATATIVGLLTKIKLSDAPKEISKALYGYKVDNQYKYHTHILTIPLFTKDYIDKLEAKAKVMMDNKFTRRSLDKNMVLINYDLDTATNTFVQLKENEKKVSKSIINLYSDAEKIITKQVAKYGFISEPKLIERLYRNGKKVDSKITKEVISSDLSKISNLLCKELGLDRKGLTNKLRSELKIKDTDIRPNKRPKLYIKQKKTSL